MAEERSKHHMTMEKHEMSINENFMKRTTLIQGIGVISALIIGITTEGI